MTTLWPMVPAVYRGPSLGEIRRAPWVEDPDSSEAMMKRHESLRQYLQSLYEGGAALYAPTSLLVTGNVFPPYGFAPSGALVPLAGKAVMDVKTLKEEIRELEAQLLLCEHIPPHVGSMIVLVPGVFPVGHPKAPPTSTPPPCSRSILIREVARLEGELRIAQEQLDQLLKVRVASDAYLKELTGLFNEKHRLFTILVKKHGASPTEW
jgi:hypothetical protein